MLRRTILPLLNGCARCGGEKTKHGAATDHAYERNAALPRWHGWHAFRRGLATNLYRLGVPDKTIQAILRHSNLATTQNIYIQNVSADARTGMLRLEAAVAGRPGLTARKRPALAQARNQALPN